MKERGETEGSSKHSGPIYVEVVRIYQTEYAEASPAPSTQQQQAQAQTQQAGAQTPAVDSSWYATQDYLVSGLVKKMRELFGVEPVYSEWHSAKNIMRAVSAGRITFLNVPATLERYKNALKQAVVEAYFTASLALARLVRQHEEFVKNTKRVSALYMQSYNKRKEELEKDIEALATLYAEIDSLQVPEKGDEKLLAQLVAKLSELADKAHSYYSKYKDAKINVDALVASMKTLISEKKDPSLEKLNQALTLLQDKNKLKDLLARFFVLMDLTRDDTYSEYMSAYGDSINSLLRIIRDQATYADFWNALPFVHVLLEMESKGWLDYGKPSREDPPRIREQLNQKYQKKLSAIEKGQVPQREPAPTVVFAEWVGKINPYKYISEYVYNSLKGVFGDAAAKAAAVAVAGAVSSAAAVVAPPIALTLAAITLTDAVADIGTRLGNPVDREILMKYVNEHWEELLINTAISIAVAVATGYAVGKIKPIVARKLESFISKHPSLAEKMKKIMPSVKVVKGEPVYESDTTTVIVDPIEKKLYIYNKATGEMKNTATIKIPRNLEQYFDDPELRLSVSTIVGNLSDEQAIAFLSLLDEIAEKLGANGLRETVKLYLNKLNTGQLKSGVGIYLKGEAGIAVDADGVSIFDPNTKRLIAITKASPQGEKFYPLLEISRQDPVAFNIYYLAKVYNINPETLLEKLSPYLNAIKEGGKPVGDVVVGSLKFSFQGDKLNILLPDTGKAIQLDLKGFNPHSLLGLVLTGKEFANTYGEAMHSLLLDAMAFGYKLLAPQVPDVLVNVGKDIVPVLEFSKILPKPAYTSGSMAITKNGVVYVSNQLLKGGVDVNTISTVNVAKNFLKTRFTQETLTIIDLSDKTLKYLKLAASQGYEGESAVSQAISIATKMGDQVAVSELAKLQMAISLVRQNLASIPIAYADSTGGVVGVVANAALTSAINTATQQLQRGNAQQAQETLQQALVKSGLSEGTARQVAQSIIQSIAQAITAVQLTTTAPTTPETRTPQQITVPVYNIVKEKREVVVPVEEYAPEEVLSTERLTGRVVVQPKYIVMQQAKPVVVPAEEYETEEVEVGETARGRAVIQPQYVVVRQTPLIAIPYKEYYIEELETRENARGNVYPVVVPLTIPVVIQIEEDFEEEETPTPTPPPPMPGGLPPPGFLPGGLPSTPGAPAPSKPPPRGRRQLEELEI